MNTIDQIYELYRAEKYDLEKCVAEIAKIIEFQFQVCEKLDCEGRIKAYEFIEKECDDLRDKIIRVAGYDPENKWADYDYDVFYRQHEDELRLFAEQEGFITTDDNCGVYVLNPFTEDYLDYTLGGEVDGYSLDEILKFLLEEEMREMWEKGQREFYCEMTVITDRLLGLAFCAATKSTESYYERSFLVRAGILLPQENTDNRQEGKEVAIPAFASYLSIEDKTRAIDYVRNAFQNKNGAKHIAVTLIALNRLGHINLDKENKTMLYRSIRLEFGVKFENASVNHHINNENTGRIAVIMGDAIKKEVGRITAFLC